MNSLFEDTDLDQLLELLTRTRTELSFGVSFQDKVHEKVQEKFEQLMEGEREAYLNEADDQGAPKVVEAHELDSYDRSSREDCLSEVWFDQPTLVGAKRSKF